MKKEKMNDKGFSLVELIIVIAFMAVLVVVLAPQYLKYVERSRNSTDVTNATAIVTACQVWAADPNAGEKNEKGETTVAFKSGDSFKITVNNTTGDVAAGSGSEDGSGAVKSALNEAAITLSSTKCKSKNNWTIYYIEGTVEKNGSITFTYSSDKADASGDAFQEAMTK